MKINTKELQQALKLACRITGNCNHIPVLGCVLIDEYHQKIMATDLDVYAEIPLEIQETHVEPVMVDDDFLGDVKKAQLLGFAADYGIGVPEKAQVKHIRAAIMTALENAAIAEAKPGQGLWCVNAEDLRKIAGSIQDEYVEITAGNDKDTIQIGENFQNLPVMDADDFPEAPKAFLRPGNYAVLNDIRRVAPATGNPSLNVRMSGIKVDTDHGKLAAVDGHRAHTLKVRMGGEPFVLPGKLASLAQGLKNPVCIRTNADRSLGIIETPEIKLTVRIEDVMFPDYRSVIPENSDVEAIITQKSVAGALKQAMLLSNDKYMAMAMTFNGGVDVSLSNPEKGEYQKAKLPLIGKNVDPPMEIHINPRYFLDAIEAAGNGNGDEISLKLTRYEKGDTVVAPMIISAGNFEAVVMLMKD